MNLPRILPIDPIRWTLTVWIALLVSCSAMLPTTTGIAADEVSGEQKLVVHEWGTFTSLQDERGVELTGINVDDEPVPSFVHNLSPYILGKPLLSSLHWQFRQKGAPRMHPNVTMRLETPVIYFYPPASWPRSKSVDISVKFRGGWLTEFFPKAQANAPGLEEDRFEFGELTSKTVSSLQWNGLKVGTNGEGPETTERVWLAPRQVPSANITSALGESERYVFYRGVGSLTAPIRATTDRTTGDLTMAANFSEILPPNQSLTIPAMWILEVDGRGACAWRKVGQVQVSGDPKKTIANVHYRFPSQEFSEDNLPGLHREMMTALVDDGLTQEEAEALLSTWKVSYFLSPGLRVFYLLPEEWTNHYLPLTISADSKIDRVMIGRLELISDRQRAVLNDLSQSANSDGKWVHSIPDTQARAKFLAGRTDFGNLGVAIPPDYQLYLSLGRFRNALVAHQESEHPTTNLSKFIDTYGLQEFRAVPKPPK